MLEKGLNYDRQYLSSTANATNYILSQGCIYKLQDEPSDNSWIKHQKLLKSFKGTLHGSLIISSEKVSSGLSLDCLSNTFLVKD